MAKQANIFTTIRTEGALLPPDLLQRISEGENIEGLTPASYHRPGEKLNEAINRSWNALQGAWANFKSAQERLPEDDLGTTITRERWLLPLFRELDYGRLQTATAVEIDGRSYPISHGWEYVPIHLVSYRVDLDTRTKGVAGASSASPHSLVQIFLNRSDDNLWGFVSNGYKLRVLRDNLTLTRQAYVEFDLEAMMDGEVYSDFVLLWLLCHQSRVEGEKTSEYWLEQWMKVAEEQGTRALEQLRDGVEAAIEALGLGFIEHPANAALRDRLTDGDLSGQDYYRQLLRIVYRLLFLFVAEDRDLLLDPDAGEAERECYEKFYSTGRLRRMAESFKGTRHPDLFEGLRLVMRLLSGDSNGAGAALGLVPLGSFLFSDRAVAEVIDCQISNQHLLDAVRALSLVYDDTAKVYRSVDYKNLGPEELGSVYESLLELHPQINVPARRFALATAGGNERKTTGSYYTPTSLINALLDSALDPVLDEAMRGGEAAILNLKICDPACGSGHFLIAAANRMAKRLAEVRTGEEEPTPLAIQEAKRDIIGHCIYGVDINPMAVELCKVNLWMEALEPGKPLSFLDHRILVGNSLLGTTPRLLTEGIPDDAFKPIEGDDRSVVSALKKQNKQERSGQRGLFDMLTADPAADASELAKQVRELDALPDDTLDGIRARERRYADLLDSPERRRQKLLADAWCSAFVWVKKPQKAGDMPPMTQRIYNMLEQDDAFNGREAVENEVARLAERYQFFHWYVAFPDAFDIPPQGVPAQNEQTGWNGGFDVVLGNPPWERLKFQEKEWFESVEPEIANARNASQRDDLIRIWSKNNPILFERYLEDRRTENGIVHAVRLSGLFQLTSSGDVNSYSLFAELFWLTIKRKGYAGVIVPTGVATDNNNRQFFQHIVENSSLVCVYDFENRERLFIDVAPPQKFCIFVMAGLDIQIEEADFVFFATKIEHLSERNRHFALSSQEIFDLNPNTRTLPIFQSKRDANITRRIYRHVPVLLREYPVVKNSWLLGFTRMFDIAKDASLFFTPEQLEKRGAQLAGGTYQIEGSIYYPLYESKLFHQYNHRYNSYEGVKLEDRYKVKAAALPIALDELTDPDSFVIPRYWGSLHNISARLSDKWDKSWLVAWRDITNVTTNRRTAIVAVLPMVASDYTVRLAFPGIKPSLVPGLLGNLNSQAFDYCTRQMLGGSHLSNYIIKQLPVIPPHTYTPALLDFIVPRVLELTYTAWDLQPFAQDVGYDGPPFIWDEARRFLMRCELDALYFHLYQINRDDVDYIMETFPIVKRKDEAVHEEYLTKRIILEMYDQMAALPVMHVPAPKDESATYAVPDVGEWETWLSPGPADPSVAHLDNR